MGVIEAKGLVKRFGDLTAVAGIDFAVESQECFGFLGANGAGKTSTMRMIACVSPVTEGELRVLQNLQVYARCVDLPREEARRRAGEALVSMRQRLIR